ncbi:unnamed protein product [Durusdinium trenchii]|uniref:Ubiquinone biosynthesis protein n=1 Tax=Durusdinium trenchii TaxID=1381693 RepID=A0ABP0J803_9DINO
MLGLACAVRPTFPRGIRRFGVAPQSVFRKLSRRAKLLGAELKDWSHEREQLLRIWTKKHLKTLQYLKTLPPDRLLELSRLKLVAANQQFDDRFNAAFFRTLDFVQEKVAEIQRKGVAPQRAEMWHHSSFRLKLLKLMDFLGLKALQRWTSTEGETVPELEVQSMASMATALAFASGQFFAVCAPPQLKKRKSELFPWLHHELHVMRQIRAGNLQYIGRVGDKDWEQAHDADLDHSPETLFDLAMSALAAHPRVHEWLGTRVRPMAEPEHVLYRLHEGVTETFLAWQVKGELGEAEVQVKSTGSIVDFIYVFS